MAAIWQRPGQRLQWMGGRDKRSSYGDGNGRTPRRGPPPHRLPRGEGAGRYGGGEIPDAADAAHINTLRRDEESARVSALERAAALDERLEQLSNELELAEHRVTAEFAVTEDQLTDALEAELHRWDVYLDRMQAKAAAKTGVAREQAEAVITDLRQRRVSIGTSASEVGTAAGEGWRDARARVLAELDELKSKADAARRD